MTQSTLSHQIKQLEQEVGYPLFDRVGKRVIITAAGEALLPYVTRALREIDDGIRQVNTSDEPLVGTLRIGTTHTFNLSLIPTCVGNFLERHPAMRATVSELYARDVERELLNNTIDVGIGYDPSDSRRCTFEPLYTEEMVLVVRPDHAFATRKRLRMVELHGQRIVVATRGTTTRRIIDHALQSVGAEAAIVAEIDAVGAMLGLVRCTNVGAIVSRLATVDLQDIRAIPLESPTPLRAPGIITTSDKHKGAALLSFIGIVRRAVPKDR